MEQTPSPHNPDNLEHHKLPAAPEMSLGVSTEAAAKSRDLAQREQRMAQDAERETAQDTPHFSETVTPGDYPAHVSMGEVAGARLADVKTTPQPEGSLAEGLETTRTVSILKSGAGEVRVDTRTGAVDLMMPDEPETIAPIEQDRRLGVAAEALLPYGSQSRYQDDPRPTVDYQVVNQTATPDKDGSTVTLRTKLFDLQSPEIAKPHREEKLAEGADLATASMAERQPTADTRVGGLERTITVDKNGARTVIETTLGYIDNRTEKAALHTSLGERIPVPLSDENLAGLSIGRRDRADSVFRATDQKGVTSDLAWPELVERLKVGDSLHITGIDLFNEDKGGLALHLPDRPQEDGSKIREQLVLKSNATVEGTMEPSLVMRLTKNLLDKDGQPVPGSFLMLEPVVGVATDDFLFTDRNTGLTLEHDQLYGLRTELLRVTEIIPAPDMTPEPAYQEPVPEQQPLPPAQAPEPIQEIPQEQVREPQAPTRGRSRIKMALGTIAAGLAALPMATFASRHESVDKATTPNAAPVTPITPAEEEQIDASDTVINSTKDVDWSLDTSGIVNKVTLRPEKVTTRTETHDVKFEVDQKYAHQYSADPNAGKPLHEEDLALGERFTESKLGSIEDVKESVHKFIEANKDKLSLPGTSIESITITGISSPEDLQPENMADPAGLVSESPGGKNAALGELRAKSVADPFLAELAASGYNVDPSKVTVVGQEGKLDVTQFAEVNDLAARFYDGNALEMIQLYNDDPENVPKVIRDVLAKDLERTVQVEIIFTNTNLQQTSARIGLIPFVK